MMKKILLLLFLTTLLPGCAGNGGKVDLGDFSNTEDQATVAVGTSSSPVSLDTNFTNIAANDTELYAADAVHDAELLRLESDKLDTADADTLVSANSDVTANTAKVSYDSTTSARLINTSGTNTGDQTLPTVASLGLDNVDNTSDANKPVSTATQTALDAKEDLLVCSDTQIKQMVSGVVTCVTPVDLETELVSLGVDVPSVAGSGSGLTEVATLPTTLVEDINYLAIDTEFQTFKSTTGTWTLSKAGTGWDYVVDSVSCTDTVVPVENGATWVAETSLAAGDSVATIINNDTVSTITLSAIDLYFANSASATGTVTVYIYDSVDGLKNPPDDRVATASSTLDISTVTTVDCGTLTASNFEFDSAADIEVGVGSTAVITYSGAGTITMCGASYVGSGLASIYARTGLASTPDDATNWTETDNNGAFKYTAYECQ